MSEEADYEILMKEKLMKKKTASKCKKAGWTCICGKTFSSFRDYFRHVTAVNRRRNPEELRVQEMPDGK